ncbi:hypothetical protein [Crateriforma conspicua]|uniref:Uncharacterized protein n=1 Tax=Crateriforma conspicua TaxID=2527996 RepID=A0A5C6FYH8_9PLAN|nr:hypothetical protein [Crateriforma conspicua]TWU66675.1 hypothetical protein V7x_22450 [Crateriforma conspicua]
MDRHGWILAQRLQNNNACKPVIAVPKTESDDKPSFTVLSQPIAFYPNT